MSYPGPGKRRTIKGNMEMVKFMSGTLKPKVKRKAPVRVKVKNEMVEKELEKKIIWELQRRGYWVNKTAMGSAYCYNTQYNRAGIADLQVYGLPNKVTMLEVKSAKGTQRKSQKEFEEFCKSVGIKYAVVRSVAAAIEAVIK